MQRDVRLPARPLELGPELAAASERNGAYEYLAFEGMKEALGIVGRHSQVHARNHRACLPPNTHRKKSLELLELLASRASRTIKGMT